MNLPPVERGYRDGRNDMNYPDEYLGHYYTTAELRAYKDGHRIGTAERLKKLPPTEDMEAIAGSEFV